MAATLNLPNWAEEGTSSEAVKAPETSHVEVYGADEETLIRLLRTKMKYALAEEGYDEDAQATVSRLIERNVISCGVALGSASVRGSGGLQADLVQPQLEDLMSGEFRINSNEVVLLILVDDSDTIDPQAARNIKEASCAILREMFHIFPVRVYVARYSSEDTSKRSSRAGFSLALLNVVNTDIGGPGMIQLLDNGISPTDSTLR